MELSENKKITCKKILNRTDLKTTALKTTKAEEKFINSTVNKNKTKIKFIMLLSVVIFLTVAGFALLPYANDFFSKEGRDSLAEMVRSKGLLGMLMFLGIQVLQVVVFVLPGEVVEVVGGMIYGTWWGYGLCATGVVLGSIVIFYLVKCLGYDFVTTLISEEKFSKLKFLQDDRKIKYLVFLLFFIPGTPKDILTFFVPLTNMSLSSFLIISSVARIPAIVSSTFAGATLQSGNVWLSVTIFAVVGVVAIAGIIFNKKLLNKYNS